MLILLQATIEEDIQKLKEQGQKFEDFGSLLTNSFVNQYLIIEDWINNEYDMSYFENNSKKMVEKIESLLQEISSASDELDNYSLCKASEINEQYDERFRSYVDLSEYELETNSTDKYNCVQNIQPVRDAYSQVFPLDASNDSNDFEYGQMYFGTEKAYLSYPILNDDINFEELEHSFNIYNEILLAPLDLDADLSNISMNLQSNILVFEKTNGEAQSDEHFDGTKCNKICHVIKKYLQNTYSEQRGILIVLYDEQYYYKLMDTYTYGNTNKLINELQILEYRNKLNPYVEDVNEVLQELIEQHINNEAKIYQTLNAPGNFNVPLQVNMILPAQARINNSYKHQQITEEIINDIKDKNIHINVIREQLLAATTYYVNQEFTTMQLYGRYDELLQKLEDSIYIVESSQALNYSIFHVKNNISNYVILATRRGSMFLGFRFETSYLLELPSNSQILVKGYLVNLLDFHKINDNHNIDIFNDFLRELSNKQRSFLESKAIGCLNNSRYLSCLSVITSMPYFAVFIIIREDQIIFNSEQQRMDKISEFEGYSSHDYCNAEFYHESKVCNILLYPNVRVFKRLGLLESNQLIGTEQEFLALVKEFLNQYRLGSSEFLKQPLISELMQDYEEFPFVINSYLTALYGQKELLLFYDELVTQLRKECPNMAENNVVICQVSGLDIVACTNAKLLKVDGFEKMLKQFFIANDNKIYTFEKQCYDIFDNNMYGGCEVIVAKIGEQEVIGYVFIVLPVEEFQKCFLKSVFGRDLDIFRPYGYLNDVTLAYSEEYSLSEAELYSLMFKYQIVSCGYLENRQQPEINYIFTNTIISLPSKAETTIGDLYVYRISTSIIYFMYLSEQEINASEQCPVCRFNIIFDENQTYKNMEAMVKDFQIAESRVAHTPSNSNIVLTLVVLIVILLCGYYFSI